MHDTEFIKELFFQQMKHVTLNAQTRREACLLG